MEGVSTRSSKKQKQKSAKKKGRQSHEDIVDSEQFDSESVTSLRSSGTSTGDELDDGDAMESQSQDYEQLLMDAIERCSEKSVVTRASAFGDAIKILSRKVLSGFVTSRKDTLLEVIEKSLKRGTNPDQVAAARMCSLVCVQLGEEDSKHIFLTLKPILISTMSDGTAASAVRASCAKALGISAFIGASEMEDICDCLHALKSVFNKKLGSASSTHEVFSCAVEAWGLLLTVSPTSIQAKDIEENLMLMHRLLEKGELNLRISAGEVIALLFEIARETRDRFRYNINDLRGLLKELATDSSHHKSKRDKKQQRSSFRDISRAVEHGFAPEDSVRFGGEVIELYSWARLRQYNSLKGVLAAGINAHLQENVLIRQIFDLGLPLATVPKLSKESRWEKQYYNAENKKERTKSRNKTRETKRAAVGIQ